MLVFREHLSICVCVSFPFGFEGGMCDLIVLLPDHRLSFYFTKIKITINIICTTNSNAVTVDSFVFSSISGLRQSYGKA